MTVEGKLKQDIPEFVIEVARFLAKISNYQPYAYAVAGSALLSLFLGLLAAGSRDWIILVVVPALAVALIGACFDRSISHPSAEGFVAVIEEVSP